VTLRCLEQISFNFWEFSLNLSGITRVVLMENLYLIFHTWSNYEMNFPWNIVRRSPPQSSAIVRLWNLLDIPLGRFQHSAFSAPASVLCPPTSGHAGKMFLGP
jgi:hypothetical protein